MDTKQTNKTINGHKTNKQNNKWTQNKQTKQ